nr:hypothetical protein [Methylomarinum sp. Ch1-1]MDP4522766.1 hypothetical protein [Methylomarinum sp. Ch1-1]
MQRNYHTDTSQLPNHYELAKQTAFHEAGHAAAIHLRNKQKRLAPVNFEIQINKPSQPNQQFSAKVVDGLLIHNLSSALDTRLSERERRDQQRAFEADVVNLLVGPLAEARYVSIRDDEIFNQRLVNTKALQNYGGLSDVEHATHYLSAFISDHKQREKNARTFQ